MTFEAAEQIKNCQIIFYVKIKNVFEHIFEIRNAKYSLINVLLTIYFKRLSQ